MSHDQHAIDEAAIPAPRKPWTPPEMSSLNASEAENTFVVNVADAEGFVS